MAKDLSKFAHPLFLYNLQDYMKIRDCFKGERAIKDGKETYLPKLTGQTYEDYENYLRRSLFFPITGKTVTTMVGLATTKAPKCQYPSVMESYFTDTSGKNQFTELYVTVFTEVTLMGRYGILIDAPMDGVGDPIFAPYIAENIVRWETFPATGLPKDVMFREYTYENDPSEKFATKLVLRYRRCFIDTDGIYKVQLHDDELAESGPLITPTFSGTAIDLVPYIPFGASGIHMEPDRPPMLDIATINLSHYLSSADLEWGRHITGLPTPVVSGVDVGTKLAIGGTSAWILPTEGAKAYYMEFLGQGLQSLEKAMVEKVGLMASVSARLVDNSTRGSEAAETVRLRYMSESASLIHIINAVEQGMTLLYNMLSKLMKANGPVEVLFSREIIGLGITFKDLNILFENYFKGGISKETLVFNLRRLEALDPHRTDADELAAIRDPDPALDPNKPPAAKPAPATA
jgi:hypothetical protein